jgi:hypothetical protein
MKVARLSALRCAVHEHRYCVSCRPSTRYGNQGKVAFFPNHFDTCSHYMTWPPNVPLVMCAPTLKHVTYSVSGPQGAVILLSRRWLWTVVCSGMWCLKSSSNIPMSPRDMPPVSSDTFIIWHASEFLQVVGFSDRAIALLCCFFLYRCTLNCYLLYSRSCPFFAGRTDMDCFLCCVFCVLDCSVTLYYCLLLFSFCVLYCIYLWCTCCYPDWGFSVPFPQL